MTSWPGVMVRKKKTGPKPGRIAPEEIGSRFSNRKKVGMRCSFDPDQMEEIVRIANRHNESFAGAVRLLCTWGLETLEGYE